MKIQLAAKFEKNLMDGYPALVRTDGRTNRTDYYSPFPTKVGGLKSGLRFQQAETPSSRLSSLSFHVVYMHKNFVAHTFNSFGVIMVGILNL